MAPLPWRKLAVVALPLGCLWFRLINNLRLEWATNPQYSYGWVVPILCLGLRKALMRFSFPISESQLLNSLSLRRSRFCTCQRV